MRTLAEPAGLRARLLGLALRVQCCLFLVGCAAHRPPGAAIPPAETHLFMGDERTALRSCVEVLRNAGYSVDETDPHAGVIAASFSTHRPLGVIVDGTEPEVKPMAGWQVGVLVLTGAALLVGGVVALTQGHETSGDGTEKRIGLALAMIDVASSIELAPSPLYDYQVAIQLLPMENNTTQIRVLLDGTETPEGEPPRAGPVHAPEFLTWFYSALDQSTNPEPETQMKQLLSTR